MRKFAVSYINFYDNNLTTEIIESDDWFDALNAHTKVEGAFELRTTLSNAKCEAFDMDCMIDVVEVL